VMNAVPLTVLSLQVNPVSVRGSKVFNPIGTIGKVGINHICLTSTF
jgi:hypothetical protein